MTRLLGITRALERPAIPARVKVDVVIRQRGKCTCGCNKPLSSLDETAFDHHPPLANRPHNSDGSDTDPPANDPRFITAMRKKCHEQKTNHPRGPHTSIDSDKHAIAHTDRLQAKHNGFWKRKTPPLPGSRNTRFKRKMDGTTEERP
jgi:hypothetical protein